MAHDSLNLPADHRRLVLQILRSNLPPAVKVWVFGSRATGRARRYSDLDLAIDAGRPLTLDETARLAALTCLSPLRQAGQAQAGDNELEDLRRN
jgi:predicted nucleotidyltransferase